ncbi:helix-turn-helix domain-containing protein [Pandoraea sp. B-6]|uniref:helix-turn-helix domain-containing protein n=1 Tax=Pandoraea sp. B-6 TaxID=1204340 RepID=UPI00035E6058|nr:helix-turn-helix domain-containing protein [Pandoraea sp. B-6]
MQKELVDRSAAASYLGLKKQTLAVWACTQRYPLPFVKIGRRVMYRIADLDAFIMANRHGRNEEVA